MSSRLEATASEMVSQVEAIVQSLEQRNSLLEAQLSQKSAEAADLTATCEQLQSASAAATQGALQQLLAAEQRADERLQGRYTACLADYAEAQSQREELQSKHAALQAQLDSERSAAAAERESLQAAAATSAAAAAQTLEQAKETADQERCQLQASFEQLRSQKAAADSSNKRQVEALQAEKQQLLLTLDKERRAQALASTARSDAGWKSKLMAAKSELEAVKAERDKYKRLCGK